MTSVGTIQGREESQGSMVFRGTNFFHAVKFAIGSITVVFFLRIWVKNHGIHIFANESKRAK